MHCDDEKIKKNNSERVHSCGNARIQLSRIGKFRGNWLVLNFMMRKNDSKAQWAVLAALPGIWACTGGKDTAAFGLSVLFIFVVSDGFLDFLKRWLIRPFHLPFLLVTGGTLLEFFHVKGGLVSIDNMNFLPILSLFLLYFSAPESRGRRETAAYFLVCTAALILMQAALGFFHGNFHIGSLLALAMFLAGVERLAGRARRKR